MDKRTIKNRPEWVITKNSQRIGVAVTWHKALDILVKQENLCIFTITWFIPTVFNVKESNFQTIYQISKER